MRFQRRVFVLPRIGRSDIYGGFTKHNVFRVKRTYLPTSDSVYLPQIKPLTQLINLIHAYALTVVSCQSKDGGARLARKWWIYPLFVHMEVQEEESFNPTR